VVLPVPPLPVMTCRRAFAEMAAGLRAGAPNATLREAIQPA
jgi:hypothetical protein